MTTDSTPGPAAPAPAPDENPAEAHRAALVRYEPQALASVLEALGIEEPGSPGRPTERAAAIAGALRPARVAESRIAGLPHGSRMVLGLAALTGRAAWPLAGLERSLRLLGVDPREAVAGLLAAGLAAIRSDSARPARADLEDPFRPEMAGARLHVHPAALDAARTVRPDLGPDDPPRTERVRQVREADGLEPILRTAALWQRVAEAPLRQTQHGSLYKRDRERLDADAALVGPIADMLEPLPDLVPLWIDLALGVGLVVDEPGTDRLIAAPAGYWSENAVHLPQMLALRWLNLRTWHERAGAVLGDPETHPPGPFVRAAVLLRLAALEPGEWVVLDDLADDLDRRAEGWTAPIPAGVLPAPAAEAPAGAEGDPSRRRPARRGRNAGRPADPVGADWLRALLLGPAYQLGLVRAAEEDPSGRRAVQLTELGRYALALGSPPPPRPGFDHFLFVQPNFEIIAYRQGLNPALIGQFSRFVRWSQLGAALEMSLTPEDLYRGLEGGLTPEAVLDRLGRHSERPLTHGVTETLRTWAERRERVAYHAAATLVEFATPEELEGALADWPAGTAPLRVAERLLLVEGDGQIPFHRFRMLGARDYRRPVEACVEVEPDGITLALDPNRSDLLVDAELARLADELPRDSGRGASGLPRRRFRITPGSLARAVDEGMTPPQLARWFRKRTGDDTPPAVRLLLHASASEAAPARVRNTIVLSVETPELLDGLLQHPRTRDFLGERLGPTSVVLSETSLDGLRRAMTDLGLSLDRA